MLGQEAHQGLRFGFEDLRFGVLGFEIYQHTGFRVTSASWRGPKKEARRVRLNRPIESSGTTASMRGASGLCMEGPVLLSSCRAKQLSQPGPESGPGFGRFKLNGIVGVLFSLGSIGGRRERRHRVVEEGGQSHGEVALQVPHLVLCERVSIRECVSVSVYV